MLLQFACAPADWTRIAAAVEADGSLTLAGIVRALLATAADSDPAGRTALAFTPPQAGAVQAAAARLGLRLLATPLDDEPASAGWATAPAERAEAVAAAESILRGQRRRYAIETVSASYQGGDSHSTS